MPNSFVVPDSDTWSFAKVQPEEIYAYEDHTAASKERSKDGAIINGGSVGINEILNYLAEHGRSPQRERFDVWAINIMTIIRNCYATTKPTRDKEWFEAINTDVEMIKNYAATYCVGFDRPPVLLFYLPFYALPDQYKRKLNAQNQAIEEFVERVRTTLKHGITNLTTNENHLKIFTVVTERVPFPHVQLAKYIKQLSPAGTSGTIWLTSHCPMDFHLYRYIPRTVLFESYHASFVEPKYFGAKVFKNEDVPFNRYTHLLFGDSVMVAPMVQRKEKKQALMKAESAKWNIRTDTEILSDIVSLGVDKVRLTTLKLY